MRLSSYRRSCRANKANPGHPEHGAQCPGDHPVMTAFSLHSPKVLALAMGGLLIVSVSAGAMSLALFTDTAAVGANTFTAGTIDITASPASALLTSSALMPGDTINGEL